MNPVLAKLGVTIFDRMSRLAAETGAINLGQGFPDAPGPEDVRARAADLVLNGSNQYPPMRGLPELRQAAAEHYRRFQGLDLDWRSEILVTSGATEALAASILALISPGDEVVLFEPLYDAYVPLVKLAGGVPRFVRLAPPNWRVTRAALEAAFTPHTRLVILNNPVNPAARVFDAEEIALVAEACARADSIAICDEVWEHIVFDGRAHQSLIAAPDMRARAVKIGSIGKMFGLTGWKVGLICAAPELIDAIAKAHQFLTFTTPPNLQGAAAYGLGLPPAHFSAMREDLARSRDRLSAGLTAAGYRILPSEGTYFLNVDLAASGWAGDDVSFCERAATEAGVASIPVSAFFDTDPVRHIVRLCFSKQDATLDEAIVRLARFRRAFG